LPVKDNYAAVLEEARREFAQKNTLDMARASGAAFSFYPPLSWREYLLPYLGRAYRVTWPAGEVRLFSTNKEAPATTSLILLHYLTGASGKPPAGKWLPFRHLRDGESFQTAFIKSCLDQLVERFGKDSALLEQIVLHRLNARPGKEPHSYLFMALPRLALQLRVEPGDRDVPARFSLLFDAAANDYLVTGDLAALGGNLATRMLQWSKEQ
jgi:hypothetical protein